MGKKLYKKTIILTITSKFQVNKKNGYKLMVDCFSSKESVLIRFQLAVELVVLIGKMFPCRGKLCRIEAGLTRI